MASVLPHSAVIKSNVDEYCKDTQVIVGECVGRVRSESDFREIVKATLATDTVLARLSTRREAPRISAARGLMQRVPLLVAIGQLPASRAELRRFIEVTLWTIYFTDHPIEWRAFCQDVGRGYAKDINAPIAYCAFRERLFYSNYAIELFEKEPSGLAQLAAKKLSTVFAELNAFVHPGHVATTTPLRPAWDDVTKKELKQLAMLHRNVCSSACMVLSARFRKQFDRLPPVGRAWFDWLVGSQLAKKLRAGDFGLPDPR
jgi:hypothetical protein